MAGQTSPLESYQTLIAMPDPPAPPESVLEASNRTPSLWSVDAIDKVRRNSMKSNSTRSDLGGNKTSQPNATVDTQCEQRRDLSHFVIKSYILDDHSSPGAISLKFRLDRIPVRQVEIQKDLFSSEEYGHQSVLDAYLDLYDHERVLISNLIDCIDSHSNLKLLKRSHTYISHRGILARAFQNSGSSWRDRGTTSRTTAMMEQYLKQLVEQSVKQRLQQPVKQRRQQ